MTQKVLSYDLGGTKVAVGVINRQGQILDEIRVPAVFNKGKAAVIKQLVELGSHFLNQHHEIKTVGIASAGPLDPTQGILLDPTNFICGNKTWGTVPFTQILSKALKKNVYLENDAAAAILAEYWMGAAKKIPNAMILTLGTGLGTGVICNGKLVRAGHGLHPEAGHVIINFDDLTAVCNCGNYGCSEAYLSGVSFNKRTAPKLGNRKISNLEIANLARKGNSIATQAFDEYAKILSIALQNYLQLYRPEIIVFTGGFAESSDLFLKKTLKYLKQSLARRKSNLALLPKLTISKLQNDAGLIGGAYVAFEALDLHR